MIRPLPGVALLVALAASVGPAAPSGSSIPSAGSGAPAAAQATARVAVAELELDDWLAIRHPGAPRWSPDGNRLAFLWESDGSVEPYWTDESREEPVSVAAAESQPPAVAVAEPGPRSIMRGFDWTPDGGGLVWAARGDLFFHDLETGSTSALTAGPPVDAAPVLAPAGDRLAFVRDGEPWIVPFPSMDGGGPVDLAGLGNLAAPVENTVPFRSLVWSADGRYLAALHTADTAGATSPLLGDQHELWHHPVAPADLLLIDTEDTETRWLERGGAYAGAGVFSSSGTIAWQEITADGTSRRVLVAEPPDWRPRIVSEERDEAWWTLTYVRAGPRWDPQRERLLVVSDRDGWAHLYLIDLEAGGDPVALTRGEYEVEAPEWSPDGEQVAFAANRGSRSERGLFLLDVPADLVAEPDGAIAEPEPISLLRGTSTAPRWRPDGERLAFLHADPESPLDVWVQEAGPSRATRLSDSWSVEIDEEELVMPHAVRFPSTDGKLVPALLFLPADYDELDADVPAVVWAHGGGIRQNRFGWPPHRAGAAFYSFHQYLLQRGYAVLMVDYRGSVGHGRDDRVAPHLDLGGSDLEDLLAAIRYLRGIGEVDVGRIGIWGFSYGGYLTLQALVQAPIAFDAGVSFAGIYDWAAWAAAPGGLWIDGRLGSPEQQSALYRERSPIHFADRLRRPLLVLHGADDRSVPVGQADALVAALRRAGREVESEVYPGEPHVFVRTASWRDAFARVAAFFDRHLE